MLLGYKNPTFCSLDEHRPIEQGIPTVVKIGLFDHRQNALLDCFMFYWDAKWAVFVAQ